ncbi:hypothetical protein JTB14_015099 [Gonioctena quinquepunctata]|nr:hypothetical protein JTB14_015099 [Gonioctena quinquepunctata]
MPKHFAEIVFSISSCFKLPHQGSSQIRYNSLQLPVPARTLDRYGISDRAGATVASAVLQDVGIIHEEDNKSIIDKTRYVALKETNLKCILKYLDESHITTDELKVIGCDGTNIDVGKHSGIIVQLEKHLNRPLQWFVCQSHANQLPLRHLINFLDGSITGPKGFCGPIGQALKGCESLPIANLFISIYFFITVNSNIIESNIPALNDSVKTDIITDQKSIIGICDAISKRTVDEKLSKRSPGIIVHSRWLRTANRILRLYVPTAEPSENLVVLVTFISKVYGPMWFIIETKPSCLQEALNVWKTIQLSRYLPKKDVIDPIILRYFAHPENIPLGMLGNTRQHIRELAVHQISKARSSNIQQSLRQFQVPNSLNINASSYMDLIDWSTLVITELLSPMVLPVEVFIEIVKNPDTSMIFSEIKSYPCHTQAVERAVKIVTEASATVCGNENRDGVIGAKLESREMMPSFGIEARL